MPEAQRRLAAIMFTDIVGYTTLTQESEALSMEILDEHNSLLRAIFPKYGGKEVKTIGDAFHVEFASALEAIRCAVEIQKALRERNAAVSAEKKIHIRIGVHVGDVMPQEQDIFGDAVNIAARVQPLALPGGICFTQDVFLQIRNKIDAPILRLGEGELKGIQVPVEIYRLILPWEKETLRFTERWAFRLQQKRIRYAIALTTLALLSIGGWWLYYTYIAPPIPAEARSIAVLPFIDLSQYHNYEYFSDGMTEELLNALAQLEELRVVARTSAFAFKGKNEDIRRIGQKLNVATVLEGSIRIQGEKMRVTAQLNRTSDGYHLWSQDYDGELKDAFAIQEKISRAIANELKIKLAGPVVKPSTGNQEAYELYLQGRYFMNKKTKEGFEKAIEYFNEALAKDPKYALAYAGLADTYGLLAAWGYGSVAEASAKAKEAAQKAVELDDTIAEVHVPLARMHWNNGDLHAVETELRRAIELNPGDATAHSMYAVLLADIGRPEESVKEVQRAIELDPLSPVIRVNAGDAFTDPGADDRAIEQYQKALELDPSYSLAHLRIAELKEKQARWENHDQLKEAGGHYQKFIELNPNLAWPHARLGNLKARLSDWIGAEAEYKRGIDIDPNNRENYLGLADLKERQSDWKGAEEYYKRSIEVTNRDPQVGAYAHRDYATYLMAVGRQEESLAEIHRALELAPNSYWLQLRAGWTYYTTRQYDRAVEQIHKSMKMQPAADGNLHIMLSYIYWIQGRYAEGVEEDLKGWGVVELPFAVEEFRKAFEASIEEFRQAFSKASLKGYLLKLTEFLSGQAKDRCWRTREYDAASRYAILGDANQALECLQKVYERDAPGFAAFAVRQPEFDSIRSDPRFIALLKKWGLEK